MILEHDAPLLIEWFGNKNMKLNEDKHHLLVSGHKYENVWTKMPEEKIWENAKQKLIGMESSIFRAP